MHGASCRKNSVQTINENGEVVRAIDADVLRQEISAAVVEGAQERYLNAKRRDAITHHGVSMSKAPLLRSRRGNFSDESVDHSVSLAVKKFIKWQCFSFLSTDLFPPTT
ncbi:MAG: hypothetical protein IJ060_04830 [Oscillospiraceae bacterium]|nr:hypothetical protein [Oscillospiraceae bacterium]